MWAMFIHAYTDWSGVERQRKGEMFLAWTKDSNKRPRAATVHISLPEHVVHDFDEDSGVYTIKPRTDW
jgi:hypothetical protein